MKEHQGSLKQWKTLGGAGGINISLDTKGVHWDKIIKATNRKKKKVLYGIGAYTMRTADRLIRKAGKSGGRAHISKPHSPPKWHVKPGLKGNFLFDVNERRGSVIIGPRKFKRAMRTVIPHAASGAEMLEVGGHFTFRKAKGKARKAFVKPRPYMAPAFNKAIPRFLSLVANVPLK